MSSKTDNEITQFRARKVALITGISGQVLINFLFKIVF